MFPRNLQSYSTMNVGNTLNSGSYLEVHWSQNESRSIVESFIITTIMDQPTSMVWLTFI